ncbi:hypothetical protein D3C76_643030 [compost metagenome]
MRAFLRRFSEEDAVVGEDRDRVTVQVSKTADQRRPEQRLELVEHRSVHQPRNHFAHVKRLLGVGRDHAVQLVAAVERGDRRALLNLALLAPVEVGDAAAGQSQGVFIALGVMVGHPGNLAVHIGPAEVLGTDHFTRRGFHQRRAGEEDGRLFADHDRFVGHRRYIGAASGAGAHDHGNLRDAQGAHVGLVEENSSEVLAVREHFILTRQVGAAGVHQIDARQTVLLGDGLGAQVLFHRQRVIRTTFDRGVVGDNHALDAFHTADPGNYASSGDVFAIHLVRRQLADLQKRRTRIEQAVDALARQQFAPRGVAFLSLRAATLRDLREQGVQGVDLFEHRRAVGGELR